MNHKPTREEVEALKWNWRDDPCWDIEDTEGFEEYRDELLQFRLNCEQEWKDQRKKEIEQRAEQLGIPEHPALAAYIMILETRISALDAKVSGMLDMLAESNNERKSLEKWVKKIDYRTQLP